MSKRSIRFSYNNLSPRNVDQMQKGPLKIGNLLDTLNNPSFHDISLESQSKTNLKTENRGEIEDKTKDSIEFSLEKEQQSIMQQLKALEKTQKQMIIIQEPQDTDYRPINPNPEKKIPQNIPKQLEISPIPKKTIQNMLQTQINHLQPIGRSTDQETQPSKPNKNQIVDNKIYTFNIIPDRQQDKQSCCDCKLLNWGKQNQRTYPIKQ